MTQDTIAGRVGIPANVLSLYENSRRLPEDESSLLALVWKRGCLRASREPVRAYTLRHVIGAELYRRSGDLRAVAELLDVSLDTAMRYTLGAVPDAVSRVVAAMDSRTENDPPA